jgi:hypothetical protein
VVLTTLFSVVSPLWTCLAALGMVLFVGHEAAQRQARRLSGWWSYGLGTGCMMMSSVLVTVFALLTTISPARLAAVFRGLTLLKNRNFVGKSRSLRKTAFRCRLKLMTTMRTAVSSRIAIVKIE